MKKDWTYKKLGEVCDLYQPKTISAKELVEDGMYPVYGANGIIGKYDKYNHENSELLMTCRGATCGTINVSVPYSWINGNAMVIHPKSDIVSIPFLAYQLKGIDLSDVITGAAQPQITRQTLTNKVISIPSSNSQQQIVAELDLLSDVIEKQKAQIEELNKLAQSIFYDMFGDPVTNEKGWEVKKIGEIGNVERGAGISKKDFVEEGLPCIHYGQLHTCLGATTHEHKTCIPKDLLPKYKIAHPGDVIMAITSEDVEGSCTSTAWLGDYDIVVGSDAAIFHHSINGVYISYYTRTKAFYNEKAKYAKGFKVTHISTSEIETIPIPLPPLSLQQEFAAKIEAIEVMKAKVRQSLKESETLFNSRMDYYFN